VLPPAPCAIALVLARPCVQLHFRYDLGASTNACLRNYDGKYNMVVNAALSALQTRSDATI